MEIKLLKLWLVRRLPGMWAGGKVYWTAFSGDQFWMTHMLVVCKGGGKVIWKNLFSRQGQYSVFSGSHLGFELWWMCVSFDLSGKLEYTGEAGVLLKSPTSAIPAWPSTLRTSLSSERWYLMVLLLSWVSLDARSPTLYSGARCSYSLIDPNWSLIEILLS